VSRVLSSVGASSPLPRLALATSALIRSVLCSSRIIRRRAERKEKEVLIRANDSQKWENNRDEGPAVLTRLLSPLVSHPPPPSLSPSAGCEHVPPALPPLVLGVRSLSFSSSLDLSSPLTSLLSLGLNVWDSHHALKPARAATKNRQGRGILERKREIKAQLILWVVWVRPPTDAQPA
jgi:hypothetical protein